MLWQPSESHDDWTHLGRFEFAQTSANDSPIAKTVTSLGELRAAVWKSNIPCRVEELAEKRSMENLKIKLIDILFREHQDIT
jgi:hypothetical protein